MKMNFISKIYSKAINPLMALTACISMTILLSCSEDLDIRDGLYNGFEDDYISVDFLVSAETHVSTRAVDEFSVGEITVFVYDNSGNILQKEELTKNTEQVGYSFEQKGSTNEYTVRFPKDDKTKGIDNLNLYVVANAKSLMTKEYKTISTVEAEMTNSHLDYKSSDGFYMAGKAPVSSNTTVELVRMAGKITVKKGIDEDGNELAKNFVLKGFYIFNPAEKGYITAGVSDNKFFETNLTTGEETPEAQHFIPTLPYSKDATNALEEKYVVPTLTHSPNTQNGQSINIEEVDITTYIVVYGEYESKLTYYALPLYNRETMEHYNIEPNHWYDLVIKEVQHGGQDTRENAVLVPCDYIIYEIHDHTPQVYSMESDGIHELGVTHDLNLTEANNFTDTFRVKWYSASPKDRVNFDYDDDITVQIIEGDDWMELKDKHELTENEDAEDNFGVQYEYTVTVKEGETRYTAQEGKIEVTWKEGENDTEPKLKRTVIVRYDPGFNVEQSCTAVLKIYENFGTTKTLKTSIDDYWAFLKNNHSYHLFGVNETSMADGKIRDRGFHFPMPYGETATTSDDKVGNVIKPWSYEYELDFSNLKNVLKKSEEATIAITEISYAVTGNSFKKEDFSLTGESDTRTLSLVKNFTNANAYDYLTGKIVFNIKYNRIVNGKTESGTHSLTMDLYHTGFFHLEQNTKYVSTADAGYYYYEVVPMEGSYWLDRNILAKSNMMYVDNELGGEGNPDAKGNFLQIADNENVLYQKPILDRGMCPPGYHIPVTSEWSELRLSNRFISGTATVGEATFNSTNYISSVGNVYFPAARYYNKLQPGSNLNANMGDASTGYYWTATEAPGMEKEEMGNWLRGLYVHGESTTYMNFHTSRDRLLIRCKAGGKIPEQENYYVSMNVHNATHVYLFDKDTKSPLYTFPGHAVSSAKSSEQWQYFSCTTAVPADDLGMIFVKIDSNEKVTLYIKNGDSFEEVTSNYSQYISPQDPNEKGYYWVPRDDDFYYDFCTKAKNRANNVTQEMPEIKDPDNKNKTFDCDAEPEVTGKVNFKKEYNNETVLDVGQITLRTMGVGNNQDLANGNFDWTKVPSGSTLKIYIEPLNNDNPGIKLFYQGWGWIGENYNARPFNSNADNKDSNLRIFELYLDLGILGGLVDSGGLIMQGQNLKLRGMTILEGNGPTVDDAGNSGGNQGGGVSGYTPKDPSKETELWKGSLSLNNWAGWQDLAYGGGTIWSSQKVGSSIRVYISSTGSNPGIQVFYVNGSWQWYDKHEPIIDNFLEIPITPELLQNLKLPNGGLVLQGNQLILLGVTIYNP